MSSESDKCDLCEVRWSPDTEDIWGPSVTSLQVNWHKLAFFLFYSFIHSLIQH